MALATAACAAAVSDASEMACGGPVFLDIVYVYYMNVSPYLSHTHVFALICRRRHRCHTHLAKLRWSYATGQAAATYIRVRTYDNGTHTQ